MGDFGVNSMFGKLTDGEEKVSVDTSLAVDEILKNVALYAPAALLAITFLYTPELSKSAGVQCFHKDAQDWTQMLYVNNYCWESLKGYANANERDIEQRNGTDGIPIVSDASPDSNLNYHRAFPFAILTCVFLGLLPTIIWSVVDIDRRIKIQADYLELGIEEALQLTLRQMVSLVQAEQESEENEQESGLTTKQRLNEHIKSLRDPNHEHYEDFKNTGVKFECFEKYLEAKQKTTRLIRRYILKRLTSVISLLIVSWGMYILYVKQDQSVFNCLVPFTPTNEFGQIRSNGVQRMVKCTLEGIPIRLICIQFLVLINLFAIIYALVEWFKEHDACTKAKSDFRDMCALSLELKALATESSTTTASNSKWYSFQYTDLDLLMYMTVRNLERENNKMWETCRFALRSAKASSINKKMVTGDDMEMASLKQPSVNDDYYDHLYGIVARGLDSEEEVEKVAEKAVAD